MDEIAELRIASPTSPPPGYEKEAEKEDPAKNRYVIVQVDLIFSRKSSLFGGMKKMFGLSK